MGDNNQELLEITKVLIPILGPALITKIREKPYGIVKERVPVKMNGISGWLVWDYIIWNELTFEYEKDNTIQKTSLFNSISDDEIKKKFDEIVKRYGA